MAAKYNSPLPKKLCQTSGCLNNKLISFLASFNSVNFVFAIFAGFARHLYIMENEKLAYHTVKSTFHNPKSAIRKLAPGVESLKMCVLHSAHHGRNASHGGEMAEWFKAHAWKACMGNTIGGSNPPLSATLKCCRHLAGRSISSSLLKDETFILRRHLDPVAGFEISLQYSERQRIQ